MGSSRHQSPSSDQNETSFFSARFFADSYKPIVVLVTFIIIVSAWYIFSTYSDFPSYLLPTPLSTLQALVDGITEPLSSRTSLLVQGLYTMEAAALGFLIGGGVGIFLGALFVKVPWINKVLHPYIYGFQSMPKIGLTPLILIWFGFGTTPKIVLSSLLVFFPVFVNTMAGLSNIDPTYFRLFSSLGASSFKTLMQLQFRFALRPIFAGLEMGTVRSILGAVVAEFLAGKNGIGVVLIRYQYRNNTAGVFAALVVLAIMAFLFSRLIRAFGSRANYWETQS